MPGLIDDDGTTGLAYTTGDGFVWLADGFGGATLVIMAVPPEAIDTETGDEMITETGDVMETE